MTIHRANNLAEQARASQTGIKRAIDEAVSSLDLDEAKAALLAKTAKLALGHASGAALIAR